MAQFIVASLVNERFEPSRPMEVSVFFTIDGAEGGRLERTDDHSDQGTGKSPRHSPCSVFLELPAHSSSVFTRSVEPLEIHTSVKVTSAIRRGRSRR